MTTPPEQPLSAPGIVFQRNISRLTLLLRSPNSDADRIRVRLDDATSDPSYPSDPSIINPVLKEMTDSITARGIILTWAIPMVVTFTEAYLQDAFTLLISGAFAGSTLPNAIVEEVSANWVKSTIRSGGPHQWVTQLKKFGVAGFPDDLASNLQKTWEFRHSITHSAVPDTSKLKEVPVSESIRNAGILVLTTDAFVMGHTISKSITDPASS